MTDALTRLPLRVSTDGGAGPYVMAAIEQLPEIQKILDRNRVRYWVDAEAIRLDGKPAVIVVNLNRRVDPALVQRLLNELP